MRKISQVYDIESPSQIKDMSIDELTQLCSDIRTFLIESISKTGGHLSSNLGIVEVTVAMHYVFGIRLSSFPLSEMGRGL